MPFFLMENITKTFKLAAEDVQVLKGINLEINRGEFLAIMGTSGSGKSTLMHLIGCLDVPTSGRFVLDDREISHLSDNELSLIRSRYIGFVFQNFYLLPYATVLENVSLPTLYDEKKTDNKKKRVIELLKQVGLEDRMGFKPSQLSGGQQQRVAIARALVNDPELILADEPTGQLDDKTSREIMSILSKMHQNGKTVVVVTHDADVAGYAQRLIRITDGMICDQTL